MVDSPDGSTERGSRRKPSMKPPAKAELEYFHLRDVSARRSYKEKKSLEQKRSSSMRGGESSLERIGRTSNESWMGSAEDIINRPNHTPIDLPPGRVSGAPRKSSMKHKGVKPTVSASSLDDSHAKPGTSAKMASEDLDRGSNDRSVAKRSKRSGLSESASASMTEGTMRKLSSVEEVPGAPKHKGSGVSALEARKLRNTNTVRSKQEKDQKNAGRGEISDSKSRSELSDWLAIKRAREASGAASEPSFAQALTNTLMAREMAKA